MRENLFGSPLNTVLSVLSFFFVAWVLFAFARWALTIARWQVIPVNWRILMTGPYPSKELWRVWFGFMAVCGLAGLNWGAISRGRPVPWWAFIVSVCIGLLAFFSQQGFASATYIPLSVLALAIGFVVGRTIKISGTALNILWFVLFFVVVLVLSFDFGHGAVDSKAWGGLLLTIMLSVVGIVASFPLGVLLAVGRSSQYPIISWMCTVFIEVVRGTPLVVVFFVAQLFVPLLLGGINVDPVLRAMVGITVFSAAYLAENVRGGLQAVPRGQIEAARAVGLSGTQTLSLIVLPQALKAVLPALVGQAIALFKDTSLVSIIGLKDLVGVVESIRANPDWIGRSNELAFTISLIYFVFSYAMSLGAQRLERQLNTTR